LYQRAGNELVKLKIKNIVSRITDMVYPPRCPVCNEIITDRGKLICEECSGIISYVKEPYCMKCGKPVEKENQEYCRDCESKVHRYEEGRASLLYDEYMSRSIYRFKYRGIKEYSRFYGSVLYDMYKEKIMTWNCEAIIPVPIHKSRLKKRGFNQAELIAKELSKHIEIPVYSDYIIRKNPTKVQKNLSGKEREKNLKKAFIIGKNNVKLKSVLVVDDIYTTGSTIDSVAECLKENGVSEVYFLSLCIGLGC